MTALVPKSMLRRGSEGAQQIQTTIQDALSSAGIRADGNATGVQRTIQDALQQAGLLPLENAPAQATAADRASAARTASDEDSTARLHGAEPTTRTARGTTTEYSYSNHAGTRSYTLYVPPGLDAADAAAAPLMMMLHGCTQTPADFAAGTRMNALADAHGVLVVYPAQTARDNGQKCWNWFRSEDQRRGEGEPAILAGIVDDIASRHRVDTRRVYVAGLSAGAAMAVILGRTYPDKFAAVGAHSGLPFGAATDVPGAFAAMQGRSARNATPPDADGHRVPTIVVHGTADHTVRANNGSAIVADATAGTTSVAPLRAEMSETARVNGRECTHTAFVDSEGRVRVEHVLVTGAGHAWSGGDPSGSHTDAKGPDASALILAFCLRHAH
ncbi:extracellular catalytic domain type 1 short-chain-length polyhydroxyalkanoate depolymerase [Luteimonas terrae]|uniref:Poly(Hydroxyalkanoate) depolymerase family esterase n=1 Tax=Luteimonas terrae TaxID=1530191 RepID=A0ABU1XZE2_9GAMM|nr:PHB depolymerase family esterase [Luteimonas terrae]MDR7193580.1 poly(hydroxyalkanoate) depolymerase family esterase [Luteimonas terrae]